MLTDKKRISIPPTMIFPLQNCDVGRGGGGGGGGGESSYTITAKCPQNSAGIINNPNNANNPNKQGY